MLLSLVFIFYFGKRAGFGCNWVGMGWDGWGGAGSLFGKFLLLLYLLDRRPRPALAVVGPYEREGKGKERGFCAFLLELRCVCMCCSRSPPQKAKIGPKIFIRPTKTPSGRSVSLLPNFTSLHSIFIFYSSRGSRCFSRPPPPPPPLSLHMSISSH